MMPARRKFLHLAASAAILPMSRIAWALDYPTRPIRLIIPFPPGGAFDAIGRPLAEKFMTLLGTTIVENQGGVGGALAATAVAHARPDGYTILLGGAGALGLYAITRSHPLYDPVKELQPISVVAVTSYAIVVHPSVPAQTLQELVQYAKANPGKLTYGTPGVGSLNHLIGELFKSLAGDLNIVHVPYKGAGPAMVDLIGGQISMVIAAVSAQLLEFHRSGKLRVVAVTSPARLVAAPTIPTAVEAGVPGLVSQNYLCLIAPAGTPEPVAKQIYQATRTALADEKLQRQFTTSGFETAPNQTPETALQWEKEEIARWTPIVKRIGLKLD